MKGPRDPTLVIYPTSLIPPSARTGTLRDRAYEATSYTAVPCEITLPLQYSLLSLSYLCSSDSHNFLSDTDGPASHPNSQSICSIVDEELCLPLRHHCNDHSLFPLPLPFLSLTISTDNIGSIGIVLLNPSDQINLVLG